MQIKIASNESQLLRGTVHELHNYQINAISVVNRCQNQLSMLTRLPRAKFFYNYFHMHHSELQVKLTQDEKRIFERLLQYRNQLKLKTVIRVAGGWVRDKLMQKESSDIDIALDDMKGEEFVTMIKAHAETKNQKVSGFGVTRFNPELSKHLETATLKIFDYSIDIVNLRSEKYTEDSRIPIIEIGTPKEDAERRDLTINSLFYNLHTGEIEDWTQKGIKDLQKGIIRTPLQPYVTFMDDPLRILRCFRFAGRFGFKIVPEIEQAVHNKEIVQALRHKVSKERVGTEIYGMLKVQNPLESLSYIRKSGLWNVVFNIPEDTTFTDKALIEAIPDYSFRCLSAYLENIQKKGLFTEKELICDMEEEEKPKLKKKQRVYYKSEELRVMTRLACLLIVYRSHKKKLKKNKEEPLIEHIIMEELKYPARYAKFINKISESIHAYEKITGLNQKTRIIKWLRVSEEKWEIALHLVDAINDIENRQVPFTPIGDLREYVVNEKLENCYLVEPHIDGTFLKNSGKKGPIIGVILDNAITWKIMHPERSKEEFLEFYKENLQFFEKEKSYT